MDSALIVDSENTRSRADGPERLAADLSLVRVGNESKGSRPGAQAFPVLVRVPVGNAGIGSSHHAAQLRVGR